MVPLTLHVQVAHVGSYSGDHVEPDVLKRFSKKQELGSDSTLPPCEASSSINAGRSNGRRDPVAAVL